ncbi:7261_t:CDS:2 [Ambispora gerdemannii]|uniref:7261_t:CDS:1 n=1 Tax=Ambispora gerdemannii TaxID=144530 RepID=A0A9N9DCT6_9GLOM|nr:7261_t:CDS:2 [Ambispora gerdemannii]
MHSNPNVTNEDYSGHFSVRIGTFLQSIREQQRSVSYCFGALGVAGGAFFGVICGIYAVLFGEARLRPWGLLHKAAKDSILHNLHALDPTNVPFISPLIVDGPNQRPVEERTRRLEERIEELEGILTDYFIDGSFITNLRKRRAATMSFTPSATLETTNIMTVAVNDGDDKPTKDLSSKVAGEDEIRMKIGKVE